MFKKLCWILSVLSLVAAAVLIQFLPDSVPMHYDLSGNVDRWGSRYEMLIFPGAILLMTLVWTLICRYFTKKAERAEEEKVRESALANTRVLEIVAFAQTIIFIGFQVFMFYQIMKDHDTGETAAKLESTRFVLILFGLLYIVVGNMIPKTRKNAILGIRLRWTMYNDNTWRRANRFAGIAMMIAGLLLIIVGTIFESLVVQTCILLGVMALVVVLCIIYSHRVYVQERAKDEEQSK